MHVTHRSLSSYYQPKYNCVYYIQLVIKCTFIVHALVLGQLYSVIIWDGILYTIDTIVVCRSDDKLTRK